MKTKNRDFLLQALDLFVRKNVDFVDAYNFLLAAEEGKKIVSFDRDFDRLGGREDIRYKKNS